MEEIGFTERFNKWLQEHVKFTWLQQIKEKGIKRAFIDEIKDPEVRSFVFTIFAVGLLCFVWGAKADCNQYGGTFLFTSQWGVQWACYNRTALEMPAFTAPWDGMNFTFAVNSSQTLKERPENQTEQLSTVG